MQQPVSLTGFSHTRFRPKKQCVCNESGIAVRVQDSDVVQWLKTAEGRESAVEPEPAGLGKNNFPHMAIRDDPQFPGSVIDPLDRAIEGVSLSVSESQ
jgi:hypothetical protein